MCKAAKFTWLLLITTLIVVAPAFSQQNDAPVSGGDTARTISTIRQKLSLSEKKTKDLVAVFKQYRQT